MMKHKNSIRKSVGIIITMIILFVSAMRPLVAHAGTLEHNPAFSGMTSRHTITYTYSSVSGYATVSGMPQSSYRLSVSGAGLLQSGAACGYYSGVAVVDPDTTISVQGNHGTMTGHPESACGTATVENVVVLSGGAVVSGGIIAFDSLP